MTLSFLSPPADIAPDAPVAMAHAGGTPEGMAPGYALPPGAGPSTWFFESPYTMKARNRDTDGMFGFMEIYAPRGWGAPAHSHSKTSEALYVLEGEADFAVGDTVYPAMKAGSFIYIPHTTRHEFHIRSAYGKLLLLTLPGGFEKYFEHLGTPATQYTLPQPEQQRHATPEAYIQAKAIYGAMPTGDGTLLPPLDE